MKQQFILGDSQIDLSRNQIERLGQCHNLPPKAMAVLACLAEHQGQVISQDTLLDRVWAGTIVSPNTLQRSITQLRKALGDDSKSQSIIKTHSKQGYSLEVALSYPESKISVAQQPAIKPGKFNQFIAVCSGLIFVVILGFTTLEDDSAVSFMQIVPVTATDAKEAGASYSPDGRYIVFNRFAGLCENHIWAKEVESGKEIQLTQQYGIYSAHHFSPDGKQLVIRARETCSQKQPTPNNSCWNLLTLNFHSALKSPKLPKLQVSCQSAKISDPKWLSNGHIAVLQFKQDKWQLVSYQPGSTQSQSLYAPTDRYLYAFAHSPEYDRTAVLSLNAQGIHLLDLLDGEGRLVASNPVDKPRLLAKLDKLDIDFSPNKPQLLFSSGKQVYTLAFDGKVEPLSHLSNHHIFEPKLHPTGQKLLATYGQFDRDIAQINLNDSHPRQQTIEFNQAKTPYPSLDRSINDDRDAVFQPNGRLIAFLSERSGRYEIWLNDGQQSKQLTSFQPDSSIGGFAWHPEGRKLIANYNGGLLVTDLDGQSHSLDIKHPVTQLHQWPTDSHLLLTVNLAGQPTLAIFNIENRELQKLAELEVMDAKMAVNGDIVYLDFNRVFWRASNGKVQSIDELSGLRSAKRFVVSNNQLYGIANDNQMWSYDLTRHHLSRHHKLDPYVNYLSDIKDNQLLLTQLISIKKDVVEFLP